MRPKKLATIAATATLALAVVLAGCSSTDDTATEATASTSAEETNDGTNPAMGMVDPLTQNGAALNAVIGATGFIDTANIPGPLFLIETSDPLVVEVSQINTIDMNAPNYKAVAPGTATISFYEYEGEFKEGTQPTMTFTLTVTAP